MIIVRPGNLVEAKRNVEGVIIKGTRLRISKIKVEPRQNVRGCSKRIIFEEYGDRSFNPKRFMLIDENDTES